ncbi:tyrosine protein phosphatase 1 [Kalmusia sp. IMI 367209]|nr:tyrosine protein phosphatase 1 [Kalmusia sp. IMI 367209]
MSGSLQVPPSPSSSKRSRSRDSARSAATSSLDTPYFTPSASAPSLVIPTPGEQPPNLQPSAQDPTPYPAFLRLNIHQKFVDLEWEQRQRVLQGIQNGDSEQPSRWARPTGEDVKDRNRYLNVDPYQSNRVRLKVPEGLNDYINASPVELKSSKSDKLLRYIATQGPKYDTCSHFWRMVWHETSTPAVIVMLTQTHESSREKCFPYYPQSLENPNLRLNAQDEYEDGFIHELKLASLEDQEEVRAQIRELDMTSEDGSETRKIWHLLFAGWPDFLVPEGADRAALLRLIHMSREKNADNATNPRIVHCSAGVGRSGTFIALDWLLEELGDGSLDELEDSEDPILGVVDTLRQQRMMMVQSEAQLAFIYDVIRERWRERWIQQHPEEAERLGVPPNSVPPNNIDEGPSLKRQKSGPSDRREQFDGDDDERAQLEAELFDSEMDFEKGKTISV